MFALEERVAIHTPTELGKPGTVITLMFDRDHVRRYQVQWLASGVTKEDWFVETDLARLPE